MVAKELPSVGALAFLGDGVHTLYIRRVLVKKGISHSGDLNREAVKYVSAPGQAEAFARIQPHLTEEEGDVFRRARNSTHIHTPKHLSGEVYRTATGFEAVLGMLSYTGNTQRIEELLGIAYEEQL